MFASTKRLRMNKVQKITDTHIYGCITSREEASAVAISRAYYLKCSFKDDGFALLKVLL